MSTDAIAAEPTSPSSKSRERRRQAQVRALVAVLIILLLLASGVGYIVVNMLRPAGSSIVDTGDAGLTWVRSIYGWGPLEYQQLNNPVISAVGPDGTIYTADTPQGLVLAFTPAGQLKSVIGPNAMAEGSPTPLKRPSGVAVDDNGDIYVTDSDAKQLFIFGSDGKLKDTWQADFFARSITIAGDRVYIGADSGVGIFDKKGQPIATVGSPGFKMDEFHGAEGIAVAEDGSFFVADSLNGRIKAYTAEGKVKWVHPKYGETAQPVEGNLTGSPSRDASGNSEYGLPRELVLDGQGRLVVIDPFQYRITVLEYDDDGAEVVARYGDSGKADGKLAYPSAIAYDAQRDWFVVADTNNDRLQILRINGSGGGVAAAVRRAAVGPVWVCAIPFAALLLLLALLFSRRRRKDDVSHEAA